MIGLGVSRTLLAVEGTGTASTYGTVLLIAGFPVLAGPPDGAEPARASRRAAGGVRGRSGRGSERFGGGTQPAPRRQSNPAGSG